MPSDLDVHHIFPIAGTASKDVNCFTNLSVIHKRTHLKINREILDPQIAKIDSLPDGAEIEIMLPQFAPVDAVGILEARENVRKAHLYARPSMAIPTMLQYQIAGRNNLNS